MLLILGVRVRRQQHMAIKLMREIVIVDIAAVSGENRASSTRRTG